MYCHPADLNSASGLTHVVLYVCQLNHHSIEPYLLGGNSIQGGSTVPFRSVIQWIRFSKKVVFKCWIKLSCIEQRQVVHVLISPAVCCLFLN